MQAINRRAVLIALGKAGRLTTDLSLFVRRAHDEDIRARLREIKAPKAVLSAAGLYALKNHKRQLSEEEVQRNIDVHLANLGMDSVPLRWIDIKGAESNLDYHWENQLVNVPSGWKHEGLPHRISRILYMTGQPAWDPLIELIEHGLYPYGLATLPAGRVFLIQDTNG